MKFTFACSYEVLLVAVSSSLLGLSGPRFWQSVHQLNLEPLQSLLKNQWIFVSRVSFSNICQHQHWAASLSAQQWHASKRCWTGIMVLANPTFCCKGKGWKQDICQLTRKNAWLNIPNFAIYWIYSTQGSAGRHIFIRFLGKSPDTYGCNHFCICSLESQNASSWKWPIRILKSNSLLLVGLHKNKPHDSEHLWDTPWTLRGLVPWPLPWGAFFMD